MKEADTKQVNKTQTNIVTLYLCKLSKAVKLTKIEERMATRRPCVGRERDGVLQNTEFQLHNIPRDLGI